MYVLGKSMVLNYYNKIEALVPSEVSLEKLVVYKLENVTILGTVVYWVVSS